MTSLARRQWSRALATRLGVHRLEDRVNPDATYHSLAGGDFMQDWSNIGLVSLAIEVMTLRQVKEPIRRRL
jgi:hypothetical protein